MLDKKNLLRQLPAVGVILQTGDGQKLISKFNHSLVAEAAGEVIQSVRETILNDEITKLDFEQLISLNNIIGLVADKVYKKVQPKLRRVINATGIVLHTNCGRAVLSTSAVDSLVDVASGYSNLELDLNTGERGSRYALVEEILCRLTGAEAAMVVNNNAAAVLLILNTLAEGREVIVSRGQLVEIGGSFRVPDVMTQSGATLIEVGSTNKTHLHDYKRAINEETALLLKVHTSNYRIIGFTAEVSASELVEIGRECGVPVYEDLGSGVLVDFRKYGLTYEPIVQESIQAGVDVVSFSGDKLLGATQAGIIVGRKDIIDQCKKNPLTRALRVDKLSFAALESTLKLYLDEKEAVKEVPTLRMLTTPYNELLERVRINADQLEDVLKGYAKIEIIEGFSQVGGGALPEEDIPSPIMSILPTEKTVNWLEEQLRLGNPPVLARIQKDRLLIDYRTILPGEDKELAEKIIELLTGGEKNREQEVSG